MAITSTDVTLNGTFTDDQGNAVSGTLTFTLGGYGNTVPRISGTQLLPGLTFTATVTAGIFSVNFYSNQIITPGPLITFYNISFQQSSSTSGQIYNFSNNFQFSPGTFDISQLTPLGSTVPGRASATFVAPNVFAAVSDTFLTGLTASGNFTSGTPIRSRLLNKQGVVAAQTGNSTDLTVYTYTLPANTMTLNSGIRVTAYWLHNSGTSTVTYRLFFGSSSATFATADTDSTNGNGKMVAEIFNNGATNVQLGNSIGNMPSGAISIVAGNAPAIDTTANVIVKFTFNSAATQQVTGGSFFVELIQ